MAFVFKRFLNLLVSLSEFSPLALFWMIKAFLFDFAFSKISFMQFPKAGMELGLRHIESDRLKEFGILAGKIDGYMVTVKPAEHLESLITVEFPATHPGLDINTEKPRYRPEENVEEFTTLDWRINWVFRTRRAGKDVLAKIKDNREFLECLMSFYERWMFRISYLLILDSEVFCKLKSPDRIGFFPYILPSELKELVAGLMAIAKSLDKAVRVKKKLD